MRRPEGIAAQWDLRLGEPYPGDWNDVRRVMLADGTGAVLKVAAHPAVDLRREAEALCAWGGNGAVRLLRRADDALLLERLDPGTTLAEVSDRDDDAATRRLAGVGTRLHATSASGVALPSLDSRGEAFGAYLARHPDGAGPLPGGLVPRATSVFEALQRNGSEDTAVLHGDLHHGNVLLDAERGWLAIDPHGLVGDPTSDFGAMLYNPVRSASDPSPVQRLARRLDVLAEVTGIGRDRLTAWGFVQAVLSEVWRDEDGIAGAGPALEVALALAPSVG